MLLELLCLSASQLFGNAVTEGNFASLARFLSPQRLKSGTNLLAAQLLASKAQTWAQFEDPDRSAKKKAVSVPNNALTRMFRPSGVAFLSFGATAPLLRTPEDAIVVEDEEEAPLQPQPAAQSRVLPSPSTPTTTTTTPTTTRPTATSVVGAAAAAGRVTRANRGANMARLIRTVYGGLSRGAVGTELNQEPAEAFGSDDEGYMV